MFGSFNSPLTPGLGIIETAYTGSQIEGTAAKTGYYGGTAVSWVGTVGQWFHKDMGTAKNVGQIVSRLSADGGINMNSVDDLAGDAVGALTAHFLPFGSVGNTICSIIAEKAVNYLLKDFNKYPAGYSLSDYQKHGAIKNAGLTAAQEMKEIGMVGGAMAPGAVAVMGSRGLTKELSREELQNEFVTDFVKQHRSEFGYNVSINEEAKQQTYEQACNAFAELDQSATPEADRVSEEQFVNNFMQQNAAAYTVKEDALLTNEEIDAKAHEAGLAAFNEEYPYQDGQTYHRLMTMEEYKQANGGFRISKQESLDLEVKYSRAMKEGLNEYKTLTPEQIKGMEPINLQVNQQTVAGQSQGQNHGIQEQATASNVSLNTQALSQSGLTASILTPEKAGVLAAAGLATSVEPKVRNEWIANRANQLPAGKDGQFFTVEQRRAQATQEFEQQFGQEAQTRMTEDQYVAANQKYELEMSRDRRSLDSFNPTVYNKEEKADMEAFLRQEYRVKNNVLAENEKRAAQGLDPLTQSEIAQQFSPKTPEFKQEFDVKGVGNGTPLQGASLDVYKEKGMVKEVDMKEYRSAWVEEHMKTQQGRPGVDEYVSIDQRRAQANAAYTQEHPQGTQLFRKATKEEFVEMKMKESGQKVSVTFSKTGNATIHNGQNVDDARAYFAQHYDELNNSTRTEIDNRLNQQNNQQQQYFAQQGEQMKKDATAGIAGINVNELAADVKTGLEMPENSTVKDFDYNKNNRIDGREAVSLESFKTKVPGIQIDAGTQSTIDAELAKAGLTGNGIADIASKFVEGEFGLSDIASVAMNVLEKSGRTEGINC